MNPPNCGESSLRDYRTQAKENKRASNILVINLIAICFVAFVVSIDVSAQQSPSSYPGNVQRTDTPDCSDPIEADSPECSSKTNSFEGLGGRSTQSGKMRSLPTSPNTNYSDLEQFSREGSKGSQSEPSKLSPEQLTEFQKFIASTSGQVLPIFGARIFQFAPSTFAPLDMAPVPSDFVIGPGDELRIRVWGQLSFQANVKVDRSGDVYLPQVGQVHVASLTFSDLDSHLRTAIGRVFHSFDLTVDLGKIRSIQVYVAGAARQPGVYTVSSLSTLVDALFASGGPSVQGSLRRIELRRDSKKVTELDLYNLLVRGDKSKDAKLLQGDVIFIPPVGPQAAVIGSVRVPGIYELIPEEPLSEALADAGGVSAVASAARVSIERIEGRRDRHAMEVAYDQGGLATVLSDADLVRVFSIVPQYTKTVFIRGNIANPGRFAWHPGMRISELIPDKESLITRNYWWRRTQLGLPAPEFEPTPGFENLRQASDGTSVTLKPAVEQDAKNLDQSVASNDDVESLRNSNLSAEQRGSNSSLAAQQGAHSYRGPRPTQRTDVRLLAPDIDWDYAVVERMDPKTLKTELIPFDLGKLVIQHDASQDLELQSGDAVAIFSEADIRVPLAQQTKLVTLDGEFVHAGVYTVRPDETLGELISRAGGFTSNAYLYGSEFTRESVRAIQQARIDEYVQNLDRRIQRSNLALAASSASSPRDASSGIVAQNSERDLVASLRQIRASGRIVLDFKPDSRGLEGFPAVTLENGDRFVVPSVPSIVNVVGAVYNQNSFLYSQGRRSEAYLLLAGGPNKDADRKHEFVIRANGSVMSRESDAGMWKNEFDKLQMNAGDTIVVPEKTFKPSALRGVLDWSQVFSQFALGAAAINVIK